MNKLFLTILCALSFGSVCAQDGSSVDYTKGVFVVNEDWYGHNNSTINFLSDEGEWHYRVFQQENPGHELGCTSQYGTIYGNRIFIVSKQEKDPGATITGSRLAVCDATTMKLIKEFPFIAQNEDGTSIADGRCFFPVNEHKAYLGTNNGIYLFDLDNLTIGEKIKGSANDNTDGYGSLYMGQIGMMVRANDKVFAVHQQKGLLVFDAKTDTLITVIEAPVEDEKQRGFGSVVMSKDGSLWVSVAMDVSGNGSGMPYMIHVDPFTLETERVDIPVDEGIDMVPNSWYAWTADGFCSSTQENKIYWRNLPAGGSWFSSNKIFGYDIDKKEFFKVIDFAAGETSWDLYGTGFRIHPATDEIYAFCFHNFGDPTHMLARVSTSGEVKQEYSMINHYWFPAIPVFPDNAEPVVSEQFPTEITISDDAPVYSLYLGDMVSDADNIDAAIVKEIGSVSPIEAPIEAIIRNDSLIVTAKEIGKFNAQISVKFNSNGKIVTRNVDVTSDSVGTSIDGVVDTNTISVYPNPAVSTININTDKTAMVRMYTTSGTLVKSLIVKGGESIDVTDLTTGIYLMNIEIDGKINKIKFIKK